jgi:hypothetical protein
MKRLARVYKVDLRHGEPQPDLGIEGDLAAAYLAYLDKNVFGKPLKKPIIKAHCYTSQAKRVLRDHGFRVSQGVAEGEVGSLDEVKDIMMQIEGTCILSYPKDHELIFEVWEDEPKPVIRVFPPGVTSIMNARILSGASDDDKARLKEALSQLGFKALEELCFAKSVKATEAKQILEQLESIARVIVDEEVSITDDIKARLLREGGAVRKITVSGKTFRVKDALRDMGFTWDADAKVWVLNNPDNPDDIIKRLKEVAGA